MTTYYLEIGPLSAVAFNSLDVFKKIAAAQNLKMISEEDALNLVHMACTVISPDTPTTAKEYRHYSIRKCEEED